MARWQLHFATGGRLNLRHGVTLVGRHPTCDVILQNSAISRRQLLLHARHDAVELVKLGRQAVHCGDDELTDEAYSAGDGAAITIGGVEFATLRADARADAPPRWLLSVDDGPALPLGRGVLILGGGPADHLNVDGWPAAALRLHAVEAGVIVERRRDAAAALGDADDPRFDGDGFARLGPEAPLWIGGRRLDVSPAQAHLRTSTALAADEAVVLHLEPYGRGGVLTIDRGGERRSTYLARLRFALLRALLVPAPPARPGDYLDTDQLCAAIWPDNQVKTEYDLNVLLHRLRQDLLRADFEVDALIERARGSGRIRAPIAGSATITVERGAVE